MAEHLSAPEPSFSDPLPLEAKAHPFLRWVGPATAIAILIAVTLELDQLKLSEILKLIPVAPFFWVTFLLSYFSGPVFDWLIFWLLWALPLTGLIALTKKLVSNELLFGYAGEVYFYSWARKKLDMATSPFGAVKDVAILSALVGNAITLLMLVLVWPLFRELHLEVHPQAWLFSIGFVVATSMILLIFRKRVLSLTRGQLWLVSLIHLIRIIVSTTLGAMCWALVLPVVDVSWWIMLATVRQLVARLPFLPNKDVVFAGVAVFMVGHELEISDLMALMASLTLITHLVLGATLSLGDLIAVRKEVR